MFIRASGAINFCFGSIRSFNSGIGINLSVVRLPDPLFSAR